MSILDEIFATLQREQQDGNDLIGNYYATDKPADKVIEGPFVRATEIFPRVKKLIEETEKELLICLYKFHNESSSAKEILSGIKNLKKKADKNYQKISVYILIACAPIDESEWAAFNSDYFKVQFALQKPVLFGSTHTKIIVRDAEESAILTGDPTLEKCLDEQKSWTDLGTICKDPLLCEEMRNHFNRLWEGATGTSLPALEMTKQTPEKTSGPATVLYLGKNPINRPYTGYHSPYKIALLALLKEAQNNIQIIINNLNDPDILNALLDCANRGIKVSLTLGRYYGETAECLPFAGCTNIESVQFLLKKIEPTQHENLSLHWATKENALMQNHEENTTYAKIVMVDNTHILTGSSLMDKQSLRSGESDILFESAEIAKKYKEKLFDHVFSRGHIAKKTDDPHTITRTKMISLIEEASSITDITHILSAFILMREEEKQFQTTQSRFSHVWKKTICLREEKIAVAKDLLAVVTGKNSQKTLGENPSLKEGLLGDIYKRFLSIIDKESE
ncbi:MAG: phospholipase D-like domain-containing protein [Gammaproteobacteria bacterium]|nr:phospholipase D-like domain-containing protein [Gammaproteobacteria bacterium]